jgi:hypothetical protein
VSELSNAVSDQPRPVPRTTWRNDPARLALRIVIAICAVLGVWTTWGGLRDAWSHGAPVEGDWSVVVQRTWGVTPYIVLVLISMFPLSKRSLTTVLVTTLLAWFMSTGYWNLDEMGLMVLVIPFVQLVFILGALGVMFTFWLLRKRRST